MRIIDTADLPPIGSHNAPDAAFDNEMAYNALDTMITEEVLQAQLPQLNARTTGTYQFSRDLQGPILDMNIRGMLVDEQVRQETIDSYRKETMFLADHLNRIIHEGVGFQFDIGRTQKNPWITDAKLKDLFYRHMSLPVQRKRNTNGEYTETVERGALEKLEGYFYAEPIVRHIFALRDLGKKISFLSTEVDPDGRLRTSFNIAGTTTGRLASSYSDFGTGTNLQNVENRLRRVFISDPGYKFCNIDLEQGDSRGVGAIHWNLFRDSTYLDACESGDLHTTVCRGAFKLPWTGDLKSDRNLADAKFYREFSYRDAGKRLGHGTNYQGQPDKMASATKIPYHQIVEFQLNYLKQFPSFKLWWKWVEDQIKSRHKLITLLGRERVFFGHPKDGETIRAAVAFEPQSITADTIDRGLLALWKANRVQLLLQVHDSILFQYPEEEEETILPWALETVRQPLILAKDRPFCIPGEAKVGWNWADWRSPSDDPDSMMKWRGHDDRKRTRRPDQSLLQTLSL